jgi:hypothetical protein
MDGQISPVSPLKSYDVRRTTRPVPSLVDALSISDALRLAFEAPLRRYRSVPGVIPLEELIALCEPFFASGGCIVDQPFQRRLPEGMIRCYMGVDKVVGFGHQLIKALIAPPPQGPDSPAAQPGPRIMQGADAAPFRALRDKMEAEWTPQLMARLDIDAASLPIIWDANFLCGPRTSSGQDTYVLCEINVSSVFAIPDQAPAAIARLTKKRLEAKAVSAVRGRTESAYPDG